MGRRIARYIGHLHCGTFRRADAGRSPGPSARCRDLPDNARNGGEIRHHGCAAKCRYNPRPGPDGRPGGGRNAAFPDGAHQSRPDFRASRRRRLRHRRADRRAGTRRDLPARPLARGARRAADAAARGGAAGRDPLRRLGARRRELERRPGGRGPEGRRRTPDRPRHVRSAGDPARDGLAHGHRRRAVGGGDRALGVGRHACRRPSGAGAGAAGAGDRRPRRGMAAVEPAGARRRGPHVLRHARPRLHARAPGGRDRRHPGARAAHRRRRRRLHRRVRAPRLPPRAPGVDPVGARLARPRRGLPRDPGVAGARGPELHGDAARAPVAPPRRGDGRGIAADVPRRGGAGGRRLRRGRRRARSRSARGVAGDAPGPRALGGPNRRAAAGGGGRRRRRPRLLGRAHRAQRRPRRRASAGGDRLPRRHAALRPPRRLGPRARDRPDGVASGRRRDAVRRRRRPGDVDQSVGVVDPDLPLPGDHRRRRRPRQGVGGGDDARRGLPRRRLRHLRHLVGAVHRPAHQPPPGRRGALRIRSRRRCRRGQRERPQRRGLPVEDGGGPGSTPSSSGSTCTATCRSSP